MADLHSITTKLFDCGKSRGMGDMEAYITQNNSFEVRIYRGEIDGYKSAVTQGLGFRGFYQDKMGYSYAEKLSSDSIDLLVRHAMENAQINDSEDMDFIFAGSPSYEHVINHNPDFELVTETQKIEFAQLMEKTAFQMDKRIKSCQYCVVGSGKTQVSLLNTKHLTLHDIGNHGYAYIMLLAQDNENLSSGYEYVTGNDFSKYNAEELAKKAAEKAVAHLYATSIKSGEYPVIIHNEAMAGLLEAVAGIFSARAVQKNVSLLKGKLHEKIAADCISIIDNPFLKDGGKTRSFDGEGVAASFKRVIDHGVLTTYLHNLKSAKIDGVVSTGNASRDSYKDTIGISPSNMYIEKGDKSLDELFGTMINGIYITQLDGMHAGFNTISGDFSLSCKGFLVEGGKKAQAVSQITVSGNFYELLKSARAVGSDFILDMNASIGSPSILFSGLSIAGE